MAWADTLLDCSFRGVVFDVVGTKDSYGRAVSVSEVPYVDGGTAEDLGARPSRFSLQAVAFGPDYEEQLYRLLEVFGATGPGELQHPILGVIDQAQVLNYEVSHSATEPDYCTVQVEFVESGEPIRIFAQPAGAESVQADVGAAGDSALDSMVDELEGAVEALRNASPLAALDELRQSTLGPLLSFTARVQGVISSVMSIMDYPRAWARDIAALSNGLLSIASFPGNLMGEWRAITGVFRNIGAQWDFGSSSSSGSSSAGYSGGSSSSSSSGSSSARYSWPVVTPARPGSTPSEAQVQLVVRAHLSVCAATAQADAAAGLLAQESKKPTLSPADIEAVTDDARGEINAAIAAVRAALPVEKSRVITERLKDQALILQRAAQAIIERRPPLISRGLEAPGNLRLIAHLWYGDHARATELAHLNNLRNPNALQKGDVLRAYAR